MKKQFTLLVLAIGLVACGGPVKIEKVADKVAAAKGGDTIVVANGTYSDVRLVWKGAATAEQPIVVVPESEGGVVITGASNLRIAGRGLTVCGLHFKGGYSLEGAIVEFRKGKEYAEECRMTECVIEDYNPAQRNDFYDDVIIAGRANRYDHNTQTGKLNRGLLVGVNLNHDNSAGCAHRIDHNLFANRHLFGSNGAETIRVGASQHAYTSSQVVIEDNVFDHCNGEVEVVSIKSSDNIVRRNLFWECQGVLALRHGDRNVAEGNVFMGNGVKHTGGVRVVNAGHKVVGNTFVGVRGERFFSALALMNAVPNSLPNRYCLVENVEIVNNTFIDCANIEFGTGCDEERTLAPERILFEGNKIKNKELVAPFMAIDRTSGFTFRNNTVELGRKVYLKGFTNGSVECPAVDVEAMRKGRGAGWYVATPKVAVENGRTVEVADAEQLQKAVAEAEEGDVIVLSEGRYPLTKGLQVGAAITLRAAEGAKANPVISFAGSKKSSLVTIVDGGSLKVQGLDFSGKLAIGTAGARHAITTAEGMIQPYLLEVRGCAFYDFGESTNFAIRGAQNTFSDNIVIEDCYFHDISGNAVDFGAEREDIGRYNAENITIRRCVFENLLGLGVNIYRGGSDESTGGPCVVIEECEFRNVCNRGRGSALRAIGVQDLTISGCRFVDSGRGGASIRLDDTPWEKITVKGCTLRNSGRIVANRAL